MGMTMAKAAAKEKSCDISSPPLVPDQPHPWLLIHHGKEKEQQIFYSVSDESCYRSEIPELRNKFIYTCSSNGWVVMKDLNEAGGDHHLFNIFTKESVQLPEISFECSTRCVLSTPLPPPIDHSFQILFVDETLSSITLFRVDEDHHVLDEEHLDMGDVNFSTQAYFKGKFYFLNLGCLVFLDFIGSTPRLIEVISDRAEDEFVDPICTNSLDYLVESGGELLYVRKRCYGLFYVELFGFTIFRADFDEKKWVKLKDIGQRAIFLDDIQGLSVHVTPQEEGDDKSSPGGIFKSNCVYFTKPGDTCLYGFDLKTKNHVAVLPSSEVDKSHGCVHRWVMMMSTT